jgi:hypothetical protein
VELIVVGGTQEHTGVTLQPLTKLARIEHRWKTWLPWTVFGSGFAVTGIGGLLHLKASSDNSAYAAYVSSMCHDGCPKNGMLDQSLHTAASVENGFAIGLVAAGVATVGVGSAMLVLNRGRTVYGVEVVPTHDGAAVTLTGGF